MLLLVYECWVHSNTLLVLGRGKYSLDWWDMCFLAVIASVVLGVYSVVQAFRHTDERAFYLLIGVALLLVGVGLYLVMSYMV